jgi:hypothetical protein
MFSVKQPGFSRGRLQPTFTKIVGATLDQLNLKLETCGSLQEGQVFTDQLLLQIDRVG